MLNNFNVNKYMYNYAILFYIQNHFFNNKSPILSSLYKSIYVLYIQLFIHQINIWWFILNKSLQYELNDYSRFIEKWNHFLKYDFETNCSNVKYCDHTIDHIIIHEL